MLYRKSRSFSWFYSCFVLLFLCLFTASFHDEHRVFNYTPKKVCHGKNEYGSLRVHEKEKKHDHEHDKHPERLLFLEVDLLQSMEPERADHQQRQHDCEYRIEDVLI